MLPQLEAEGQASATTDVSSSPQQQQPVAMVMNDDDDDDVPPPPDYDDTTDGIYQRRWSLIRADTSQLTLASNVATEGSSLFSISFIGCLPEPPPYRPYNVATDTTGPYIAYTRVHLSFTLLCSTQQLP